MDDDSVKKVGSGRLGNSELIGIQFQFYEIGSSSRVIRIGRRGSKISSRKGDSFPVDIREGSREGVIGVVNNVIPGRLVRNGGFGGDCRLNRSNVGFGGGISGVLGITRKREESNGRENCQHGDDHDEFRERKSENPMFRNRFPLTLSHYSFD